MPLPSLLFSKMSYIKSPWSAGVLLIFLEMTDGEVVGAGTPVPARCICSLGQEWVVWG